MPEFSSLKVLSHHAYCLVGDSSSQDRLTKFLNQHHNIDVQNNPDFSATEYSNFTVNDARVLKENALQKAVHSNGRRIFILLIRSITNEAQNALLKLFEEPAPSAIFFIIVPSTHILLPTVQSRMQLIQSSIVIDTDGSNEAKRFLEMTVSRRLEFIKKLMDDISNEKKQKHDAIKLISDLERVIFTKSDYAKSFDALKSIDLAKNYSNDRSPSIKMLLEYMALNL